MCEIWQLTREEFLGPYPVTDDDLESFDRTSEAFILSLEPYVRLGSRKSVPGFEGYYTACLREYAGIVLLEYSDVYHTHDIVGGYVEETLWLAPSLRGRGLGAELVLRRVEVDGLDFNPVSYTTAGRAAHVAAHRKCVHAAWRAGQRVPATAMMTYQFSGP